MIKFSRWLIPQILILIIFGWRIDIILSFIFIFIHELFHYIVARIFNVEPENITIHPLGAALELQNMDYLSRKKEIILFLSGPIANLILALIFYYIYIRFGRTVEIIKDCYEINLTLCIFNMIPAVPLDGAKILKSVLSGYTLYKNAYKIVVYISYAFGVIFIGIFIFLCTQGKINIFLLLIGVMMLLDSRKQIKEVMYIIMGDVVGKKDRFIKRKYMINRSISVYYKEELLKLLSFTDKNKYYIFKILDQDMRMIGEITEEDVIEALKDYGNITLEEFINIKNNEL